MNPRPHSRNGANARKALPAHARPSKPPLLTKRGKSYDAQHFHATAQQPKAPSSYATSSKPSSNDATDDEDSECESGMASFLQFCTTCDRQIVTPGTNILYCSESCRSKDIGTPTPLSVSALTPLTPATNSYFDQYPIVNIVPQLSPTMPQPSSLHFTSTAIEEAWRASDAAGKKFDKNDPGPDAARYLAQFYTTNASATNTRSHQANRHSTAGLESTLPSLVHSPSSSYSTVASAASLRPLPSRQNPFSSDPATKSIELVLPYHQPQATAARKDSLGAASMKSSASTVTSFRSAEANDLSYTRRRSSRKVLPAEEKALGRLYNHEAIKSGSTLRGH